MKDIIRNAEKKHFVDFLRERCQPNPFVYSFLRYTLDSFMDSASALFQDEQSRQSAVVSSNSPVPLFDLDIDVQGFLINGHGPWKTVPAHLRGDTIGIHANTVVIGGRDGSMRFIHFNYDS